MTRKERIYQRLNDSLMPVTLLIEDESHKHRREGVETHFHVIIVTDAFQQKKRVDRHRCVQDLLKEEFLTGLHALSLNLYTVNEYQQLKVLPKTPNCQHHSEK